MPDETHATVYHPAALKALRLLFKPGARPLAVHRFDMAAAGWVFIVCGGAFAALGLVVTFGLVTGFSRRLDAWFFTTMGAANVLSGIWYLRVPGEEWIQWTGVILQLLACCIVFGGIVHRRLARNRRAAAEEMA